MNTNSIEYEDDDDDNDYFELSDNLITLFFFLF